MKTSALLPLSKVVINKSNPTEGPTTGEVGPFEFGRWGRPVRFWISLAGLHLVPLPALQSAAATPTNLIANHDPWCWLPEDNRALRTGDLQIVAASKDGAWEFDNFSSERSESNDLAIVMPKKVLELAEVRTRQREDLSAFGREQTAAAYPNWQHAGSLHIITAPEGAYLPPTVVIADFPLLVRLHQDFFPFSQARANGEDLRLSSSTGSPLAYQIEEWDAGRGTASIWVRIRTIKGNARQEIKLHWRKADAVSESSGSAVFNESNGYLSVWHMSEAVKDEVGTLESKDVGTTPTEGMIGPARHLAGEQGVFGGDKITSYPTGAVAHTSEAWFRPEKPNVTVLA